MNEIEKKSRVDLSPCIRFVVVISALVLLGGIAGKLFFGVTGTQAAKIIFWNIEYFFVFALSLEIYGCSGNFEGKKLPLTLLCYFGSFLMVIVSREVMVLNFWMAGTLLLGLYLHPYMGTAFQLILSVTYCMVNGFGMDSFVCVFTLGALCIFLSRFMNRLLNILFILLILLTTNGAFMLIQNNFEISYSSKIWMELVSTALLVILVYAVQTEFAAVTEQTEEKKTEPLLGKIKKKKEERKIVFREEEAVTEEIKQFSYPLFKHCREIAELSKGAAKVVGANAELARIGGLYHEYGRVHGGRYVEEGVKMLRKHQVPKEIRKVVEEHNINYKMPTSREAVVVMLSDSIVSTIKYLEKRQENVPVDKVVESIFNKRMEVGVFSSNQMSKEEIERLKQYYFNTVKK